jgi:hypothetical protein
VGWYSVLVVDLLVSGPRRALLRGALLCFAAVLYCARLLEGGKRDGWREGSRWPKGVGEMDGLA